MVVVEVVATPLQADVEVHEEESELVTEVLETPMMVVVVMNMVALQDATAVRVQPDGSGLWFDGLQLFPVHPPPEMEQRDPTHLPLTQSGPEQLDTPQPKGLLHVPSL